MTAHTKSGGAGPTAYLDTSLVIGIASQDLGDEQAALLQILKAHKQGSVRLLTSHVTDEEIQKGTNPGLDEAIYALLADVPAADETWLFPQPLIVSATTSSGPRGPVLVKEEDLGKLEAILPDLDDARHVFQAIKSNVTYFVTVDRRSILRYAPELQSSVGIRAVLPSELVAELGL
jgi:hypothetical protein